MLGRGCHCDYKDYSNLKYVGIFLCYEKMFRNMEKNNEYKKG